MKKKLIKLVMVVTLIVLPLMTSIVSIKAIEKSPLVVSTALGDSPTTRIFKVYNPTSNNMSYQYIVEGSVNLSGSDTIGAGKTNVHEVKSGNGSVTFQLHDNNGSDSSTIKSLSAYNVKVYYRCDGKDIKKMTYASCSSSKPATVTAPKSISANGRVYNIVHGNYKEASYGTETIVFEYALQQRESFESKVVFLDQDGNTIKATEKFSVTETNGGTFTAPNEITFNSRQYKVMANQVTKISQKYDDGAKTYYVRYQLQESTANLPYYITIDYKDGNTLLARKTITVQSGKTVTFEAPDTYKVGTTTYKLAGNQNISHKYGENTKNYTVQYQKVVTDSNQPYDVYVNYIDVATGKTLEAHSKTVDVDKTVKFNIPGSVKINGINYILSAGQPTSVNHKFGTNQTQYNVYFHEKDLNIQEYPVTVSYYDITSSQILYTTKLTVKADEKLNINVPSDYTVNGKNYVLLSGQDNENTHDFYSTRRSYTFIYRDAEDLANQSVVVVPGGNVNVVETPNGGTVTIDNATGRTVITVPEQNTPLVVDDNGNLVPEDADTNQPTEVVDDDQTPLAKGTAKNQSAMIIGGSVVGVAVIAIFIFLVIKKRRESNTDQ
ncbi:hypothetical protein [Candidatus Stoquefichus massiliensis]|uniref:hypothetical protein n=1 Tax=Candidatus Stoquefichus massiliensis TaxID=1470350 RepID=UPI000482AE4A|nr:hypothetical protein [Candidatus Stoquefichus massiliensis]